MSDTPTLPYITQDTVLEHVSMADAVDALQDALRDGLEPADAPERTIVDLDAGGLLLMPGQAGDYAGIKVVTAAPDNPALGVPKIQGIYLLFDRATLSPLAVMDGAALTSLRTPALSALGVRHLCSSGPQNVLVFGTGPQAHQHVHAVAAVREVASVTVIGRTSEKASALADTLVADGFNAKVSESAEVEVPKADLVLCCTSSRDPLFDGALVRDDAVVVAMGSHEPELRETDDTLLRRSTVYVEDAATAMREAGDVIIAVDNGTITESSLHSLRDLVVNGPMAGDGPAFYKTVGMGWQDLVVADVAYQRITQG